MNWIKRNSAKTVEEVFLHNLGVDSLDDVNEWFRKSYNDEYYIDGLEEAVNICMKYKNEPVHIIGDYDADGITGTVILLLCLQLAGFRQVSYIIPDREKDGYGLNPRIVDSIDSGLILLVDNGIAQIDALNLASDKKLCAIILDHHLPMYDSTGNIVLPKADAIIDPNAIEGQAFFSGYCGAGIAYKFAKCMLAHIGLAKYTHLLEGLAAMGTVGDVMELKEENYVIVRNGLKKLSDQRYCTTGMYALMSAFSLNHSMNARNLAFTAIPAINAQSRMLSYGANRAVELLKYNGPYESAVNMAEVFIEVNNARKDAKKNALANAETIISDCILFYDNPMVLYLPKVKEGIIGIVAGNIAEKYKVPAFVFTDSSKPGILKGSARSYGNYDVKKHIDAHKKLFIKAGGHKGAAGMSITLENLDVLRETLINDNSDYEADSLDEVYYDLEITTSQVASVLEELEKYEPFGEGNPAPVFKISDINILPDGNSYVKYLGDGSIVKLRSSKYDLLGFDMADKFSAFSSKQINCIGTIKSNYFNGTTTAQVEMIDFDAVKPHIIKTDLAKKLEALATT